LGRYALYSLLQRHYQRRKLILAGGPGDSKEDVKWLDEKLVEVGL